MVILSVNQVLWIYIPHSTINHKVPNVLGSSVATSLCQGEAVPKHVGLLQVNNKKFKLKKLKLNTVRPFVFDDLILSDHQMDINYSENYADKIRDFVDHYIEHTIIPQVCKQTTS